MRCFHSLVVPAKAGTYTPCSIVFGAQFEAFLLNKRRWLWVPAFAGTTKEDSIVKQQTRFYVSRREAPEALIDLPPKEGVGNAGCPLHPQSRVHLVVVERTRVTTSTPESPDIPARNGFNGFLRALPGDRACLPPSPADRSCLSPVGPTRLRKLDASVGASEPHDFAVRSNIVRQLAVRSLTGLSPTRPAIT